MCTVSDTFAARSYSVVFYFFQQILFALLLLLFFFTPTSFMLAAVLKLRHTIPSSEHESVLAGDDMVNVAVVVKDVRTKERVLDTQEFSMSSPQITIEVPAASCIKYC